MLCTSLLLFRTKLIVHKLSVGNAEMVQPRSINELVTALFVFSSQILLADADHLFGLTLHDLRHSVSEDCHEEAFGHVGKLLVSNHARKRVLEVLVELKLHFLDR